MNRCAARGCGRWTGAGAEFCRRHGQDHDPGEDEDADSDRLATFRARVAAGDYDAVLAPGLREVLRGAAADPGLDAEIGAMRLALVRLLDEERDASRMAVGVARVAGVAVQAARLRQGSDAGTEEIQSILRRVLADVDAETEQRRRERVNPNDTG